MALQGARYQRPQMLNVLTFSTLYPNPVQPHFGGFVERQTLRLAARTDVTVKVMAPVARFLLPVGPYAAQRGIPSRETRGLDVLHPTFLVVPAVGWRFNPYLVARAAGRALRELAADGFRPDIIDCEFFWPDGPAAVALGRAFNIPVSIKARGSDIRMWGKRPAAARAMVWAAEAADGLLAVSEALKKDMVALGMPEKKIRVHLTGVELDRFQPGHRAALRQAHGLEGPLLLTVGNLVPLKRQALIVEAMQKLPTAHLLIVGEGPERTRLKALVEARGLADRVALLGNVDHEKMPELMAVADVLVHAASSEGLANVWIEALACGTPVVTSNVGGAAEVLNDATAGRLLDDVTPDTIAAAVRDVLADPPKQELVRQSALRFDWQRNTDELYAHLSALKR